MKKNENKGFLNLAKRTMAVISGSISALVGAEAQAAEIIIPAPLDQSNIEVSFKKDLKPQFTLRLNSNPEKSMLFMHRSHSSHSSHRSHSSHSSHYSSSSTYSPPPVVRTTTPTTSTYNPSSSSSPSTRPSTSVKNTLLSNKRSSAIKSTIKSKSGYKGTSGVSLETVELVGFYYRELYKGCEGYDVEYLQQLLVSVGYETPTTGYFGDKTEAAVIKFQKENELKPDGKVKAKTHQILNDKVDGI